MPYPNEHSCRLVNPDDCRPDTFQRKSGAKKNKGRNLDVIYAELKSSGEKVEQSYRYPTEEWSEAEAREHCKENQGQKFEPASARSSCFPEIFGKSWAITMQGLESLMAQAEEVDRAQALLAKTGEHMRGADLTQIRDGVAIIDIVGPIFHYENLLTWILGWPSSEILAQDIQKTIDNPGVSSVVLNIDSPGGQVGGINELAGIIAKAKSQKPVRAYVSDLGASAAYWLASAADEITVDATAELGSIGVVFGLRKRKDDTLEIVNSESPLKRPDINTDEGLQVVKQRADALAEVFIQAVMKNRNLTRQQVTSLKGGVLVGQEAVDAGLADQVGSMEDLLENISTLNGGNTTMPSMTIDELKKENAALYEQIKEEGKQEAKQSFDEEKDGIKQEAQAEALSMAKAVIGDESARKLEKAIQTGLTADQLKQAQGLFSGPGDGSDSGGGTKDQMLTALQKAHGHEGLQPGSGNLPAGQNPLTTDAEDRAGKK